MRRGQDEYLDARVDKDGKPYPHTIIPVYQEMLLSICHDYAGLPDPRTMTLDEIRFFYEGIRSSLQERTKPS